MGLRFPPEYNDKQNAILMKAINDKCDRTLESYKILNPSEIILFINYIKYFYPEYFEPEGKMKSFFYSLFIKIYTFVKQFEHTWYDETMFKDEKMKAIKNYITGKSTISVQKLMIEMKIIDLGNSSM